MLFDRSVLGDGVYEKGMDIDGLEGANGTGHCILVFSVLVLLTVPISSEYLLND